MKIREVLSPNAIIDVRASNETCLLGISQLKQQANLASIRMKLPIYYCRRTTNPV